MLEKSLCNYAIKEDVLKNHLVDHKNVNQCRKKKKILSNFINALNTCFVLITIVDIFS